MAQHYDVDGTCPVCGGAMTVARLHCETCGSSLEGAFTLHGLPGQPGTPTQTFSQTFQGRGAGRESRDSQNGWDTSRFGRLARLDSAQLEFVEAFLRCRGVIRSVEDMLGISYPTVRARLNTVLDAMGFSADGAGDEAEARRARREILERLASGQITTEDAHRQLAGAPQPGESNESGADS